MPPAVATQRGPILSWRRPPDHDQREDDARDRVRERLIGVVPAPLRGDRLFNHAPGVEHAQPRFDPHPGECHVQPLLLTASPTFLPGLSRRIGCGVRIVRVHRSGSAITRRAARRQYMNESSQRHVPGAVSCRHAAQLPVMHCFLTNTTRCVIQS